DRRWSARESNRQQVVTDENRLGVGHQLLARLNPAGNERAPREESAAVAGGGKSETPNFGFNVGGALQAARLACATALHRIVGKDIKQSHFIVGGNRRCSRFGSVL